MVRTHEKRKLERCEKETKPLPWNMMLYVEEANKSPVFLEPKLKIGRDWLKIRWKADHLRLLVNKNDRIFKRIRQ